MTQYSRATQCAQASTLRLNSCTLPGTGNDDYISPRATLADQGRQLTLALQLNPRHMNPIACSATVVTKAFCSYDTVELGFFSASRIFSLRIAHLPEPFRAYEHFEHCRTALTFFRSTSFPSRSGLVTFPFYDFGLIHSDLMHRSLTDLQQPPS